MPAGKIINLGWRLVVGEGCPGEDTGVAVRWAFDAIGPRRGSWDFCSTTLYSANIVSSGMATWTGFLPVMIYR